ncbi:WRKY transcription factor [Asimina triloba]
MMMEATAAAAGGWELKPVINELAQGQDLAKQLQIHLDSASPPGHREALVQSILASYARVFSLLQSGNSERGRPHPTATPTAHNVRIESPRSLSGSPRSENSARDFRDQDRRDMCKKRKMLPKWTEQVRVCTGAAFDGPLDDGYSWRKYGQKDILGAKYPRGYYRCTHRNTQGCLATKQVQRSDEDAYIFEVSYRGNHTCQQSVHQIPKSEEQAATPQGQQQPEMLLNLRNGLRVKTEDLDSRELGRSSSFSFRFPSNDYISSDMFSASQELENNNNLMGSSFSPPFISPATSESNYLSMSPCQMNSGLPTPESDPTEIASAIRSSSNSRLLEFDPDFNLEPLEFDPNFPIDAYFP